MAKECQVTGKKPVSGNNVSHANNKTKRRFMPNLQNKKFWVESENRWVSLKISNAALRTIDKLGIDSVIAKMKAEGKTSKETKEVIDRKITIKDIKLVAKDVLNIDLKINFE